MLLFGGGSVFVQVVLQQATPGFPHRASSVQGALQNKLSAVSTAQYWSLAEHGLVPPPIF